MVISDGTYQDERCHLLPFIYDSSCEVYTTIRARPVLEINVYSSLAYSLVVFFTTALFILAVVTNEHQSKAPKNMR